MELLRLPTMNRNLFVSLVGFAEQHYLQRKNRSEPLYLVPTARRRQKFRRRQSSARRYRRLRHLNMPPPTNSQPPQKLVQTNNRTKTSYRSFAAFAEHVCMPRNRKSDRPKPVPIAVRQRKSNTFPNLKK